MTQTLEATKGMNYQERKKFYSLLRSYEKNKNPGLAQRLESEYGLSIDQKDYGADQGVEKGETEY